MLHRLAMNDWMHVHPKTKANLDNLKESLIKTKIFSTHHGNGSMSYLQNIQASSNIPIYKRYLLRHVNAKGPLPNYKKNNCLPLSTTGRCKNFPSCMRCNASRIVVSNVAHSGFGVITFKIRVNITLHRQEENSSFKLRSSSIKHVCNYTLTQNCVHV